MESTKKNTTRDTRAPNSWVWRGAQQTNPRTRHPKRLRDRKPKRPMFGLVVAAIHSTEQQRFEIFEGDKKQESQLTTPFSLSLSPSLALSLSVFFTAVNRSFYPCIPIHPAHTPRYVLVLHPAERDNASVVTKTVRPRHGSSTSQK